MTSHPNRGTRPGITPTPDQVRAARMAAGLSQSQAAALIDGTTRSWQGYECDIGAPDHRRMHSGLWRLFRARTAVLAGAPALALKLLELDA